MRTEELAAPPDGNIVHWSAAAPPKNGDLYTDADWNEASTIDTEPYPLSKTLAEKAAWDIAQKENFDLVTINPVRTCRRRRRVFASCPSHRSSTSCLDVFLQW